MQPMSRIELAGRLRREAVRFNFRVEAKIVWPSRTRWARVTNISRTGMFIEMAHPPKLNVKFSVYLALDTPLHLDCITRRVIPYRGIAVTLSVPQEEKDRFDALIQALAHGLKPATADSSASWEHSLSMSAAAGNMRR